MFFDLEELSYAESYRLLVNTVVPRPIALVTTVGADGKANAAPFSFFNLMGHDPPILILGIERRGRDSYKDTLCNLKERGEFAVSLVNEALAEAMNVCGVDFPPHVDELAEAGLETAPAVKVAVPLIAVAPVTLECTVKQVIELGEQRNLVIGNILGMHLQDSSWDPETRHVLTDRLGLIGRMHGRGWYVRTTDLFYLERKMLNG